MTSTSSPDRLQHFMVTRGIAREFGGMTTMCLYRAELFRRSAGIRAPILTFDPVGTYDEIRGRLRLSGLLHAETPVLNLYEFHRALSFTEESPIAAPVELPTGIPDESMVKDTNDSSGALFSSTVTNLAGNLTYQKRFFRKDGSLFAQDVTPPAVGNAPRQRLISLFNEQGEVVRQYTSGGKWYRDWLDMLVDGKPSVFIVDSAVASRFMSAYKSPYAVKAAVFHSNHVGAAGDPFRGRLAKSRKHIADNPHDWDGMVFLTDQQREDFITRFGETNNLFTVPNPRSRLREEPDPALRQQQRGAMLCRLEAVKNVRAAIEIIDEVRKSVPNVQLDIYGDGTLKRDLASLISGRGLERNISLKGYVQHAADELQRSTFSLLTSKYEGQPLSLMESQAHGCPPVSFDIRYGPRDLIRDGDNGFLVAAGDIAGAARRVVELCAEPEGAAAIGRSAWESSKRFDDPAVLEEWQRTIETMWKQQTVRPYGVHLAVRRVEFETGNGVSILGEVSWSGDAQDGALPAVFLQAMTRTSGTPRAKRMSLRPGQDHQGVVHATFNQLDLDLLDAEEGQPIDFNLVATYGNARTVLRVPFGNSSNVFQAYPTVQNNLSFKSISQAMH